MPNGQIAQLRGHWANTVVTLHGWNNEVTLAQGANTVLSGAGNDVIHLVGGTANLIVAGWADAVFLDGTAATIADSSSDLMLHCSGNASGVINGFGADRDSVIDLMAGAGGYGSGAAAFAALTSDGHGGSSLALSAGASIDFLGLTPDMLHASNFRVG